MKVASPIVQKVKKLPVSAINIARAADRLLWQRLVSTEIDYIQRTLEASSTQKEIDANVFAIRKMRGPVLWFQTNSNSASLIGCLLFLPSFFCGHLTASR